jgi:hypothetical protein
VDAFVRALISRCTLTRVRSLTAFGLLTSRLLDVRDVYTQDIGTTCEVVVVTEFSAVKEVFYPQEMVQR